MGKEREIICVLFFPFQIPIYFEFLVLTRYELFNKLETDEVQKRWASVRNEVEKYETKSQILYVLDWPASSGDFYWVVK